MKTRNYIKLFGAFAMAMPMVMTSCGDDGQPDQGNPETTEKLKFEETQEGKTLKSAFDTAETAWQQAKSAYDVLLAKADPAIKTLKGDIDKLEKELTTNFSDTIRQQLEVAKTKAEQDKTNSDTNVNNAQKAKEKAEAINKVMKDIKASVIVVISLNLPITDIKNHLINEVKKIVHTEEIRSHMEATLNFGVVPVQSNSFLSIEYDTIENFFTSIQNVLSNLDDIDLSGVKSFFQNNTFTQSLKNSAIEAFKMTPENLKNAILEETKKQVDMKTSASDAEAKKLKDNSIDGDFVRGKMKAYFDTTFQSLDFTTQESATQAVEGFIQKCEDAFNTADSDFKTKNNNHQDNKFDEKFANANRDLSDFNTKKTKINNDITAKKQKLNQLLNASKNSDEQKKIADAQAKLDKARDEKDKAKKALEDAKKKFEDEQAKKSSDSSNSDKEKK